MKIPSLIYDRLIRSRGIARRLWSGSRALLVALLDDPSCVSEIHGKRLEMPLSHALPGYLHEFPQYDRLLGRLSDFLHRRDGHLTCIDVGANIGDSVAALYKHDNDLFLAIEPNPHFLGYLRRNWGAEQSVTILNYVVSSSTANASFAISEARGTSSIMRDEKGIKLEAKPLDEIVQLNPRFSQVNFLKIDTDGHDFEVIMGATQIIAHSRPTILFECADLTDPAQIDTCVEALRFFTGAGYASILIYDNFGYLMGRHGLNDLSSFRSLLFYQLTSRFHYCDILVMNEGSIDAFHQAECSYFIDSMPNAALKQTASAVLKVLA